MAKATVILHKKGKGPKYPIYVRYSDQGKRFYQSVGFSVRESDFDEAEEKVKPAHSSHKIINAAIAQKLAQFQVSILTGETPQKLRMIDFFVYSESLLKKWHNQKAPETLRQHKTETSKLKKFIDKIPLSQMNANFLTRYESYMRESLLNETNTIWKTMKFLRTVLNQALKDRFINSYPFHVYKMPPYKATLKPFLSTAEILAIKKFVDAGPPEHLRTAGVMFLAECMTGLRYSDIKKFNYKRDVQDGRLYLLTQKTKGRVGWELSKPAKDILLELDKLPQRLSNARLNIYIKEIAVKCEIHKEITSHIGRHSFCMQLSAKGVPAEHAAKIMGISLKVVQTYYDVTNEQLDKVMRKFKY